MCVKGHNHIQLKTRAAVPLKQQQQQVSVFYIYLGLAIGSIVREEAQKEEAAGNSWWKFSATFLVANMLPNCLLKDASWGKWEQPSYNASAIMRKPVKPEHHACSHVHGPTGIGEQL